MSHARILQPQMGALEGSTPDYRQVSNLPSTSQTTRNVRPCLDNEECLVNIFRRPAIWFHCKQVSHCGLGMVGCV